MKNSLQPIENNNQRVLTTAQIAEQYETDSNTIKNNFNRNKERYVEGKHYYCLTGDDLKLFKDKVSNCDLVKPNAKILYLWTEKGALLHAKSLNDVIEADTKLTEIYLAIVKELAVKLGI